MIVRRAYFVMRSAPGCVRSASRGLVQLGLAWVAARPRGLGFDRKRAAPFVARKGALVKKRSRMMMMLMMMMVMVMVMVMMTTMVVVVVK